MDLKLGFLASHGGSNMQSILDSINGGSLSAEACVVISNNSTSQALQRAKKENIPHYHISEKTIPVDIAIDDALIEALEKHGVNLVILAGYMKKLGDRVIQHFRGRVINIHPALLPKYGGKGMYGKFVHQAVIEAGEEFSGPTIHLVDDKYDHGRILSQSKVPVLSGDTIETLSARVLKQEHILYPTTLQKISNGEIEI